MFPLRVRAKRASSRHNMFYKFAYAYQLSYCRNLLSFPARASETCTRAPNYSACGIFGANGTREQKLAKRRRPQGELE